MSVASPGIVVAERVAAVPEAGVPALERAAGLVRDAFAVERVSVARIDTATGNFEIAAEAGGRLLPPGTVLPLETCSYFAGAPDGRAFGDGDFDASSTFRLPLDGVIIAAGYHAGCSLPIERDGRAIGALSLSASQRRGGMTRLLRALEPVADVLAGRLVAAPAPLGRVACASLTPRELQLLRLLEEGLRFKQVARVLAISEATAKTHGRNLFRKLGASSRAEAVHLAREDGLLT
jgi:DNA-binding CsgD family transcriptional regulator